MNDERTELGQKAKALYVDLAAEFITRPEHLAVQARIVGDTLVLHVEPHTSDVGKLTGTRSFMRDSLVTVFTAIAMKYGLAFEYDFMDHRLFDGEFQPDFAPRQNWPRVRIMDLLNRTCGLLFRLPYEIQVGTLPTKTKVFIDINREEGRYVTELELCSALSRVFNAIGKANGRIIYIERIERKGTNHVAESAGRTE